MPDAAKLALQADEADATPPLAASATLVDAATALTTCESAELVEVWLPASPA
ncbi:MAG: hypothetical protein U1F51_01755 [Burkholderiales bacterium]